MEEKRIQVGDHAVNPKGHGRTSEAGLRKTSSPSSLWPDAASSRRIVLRGRAEEKMKDEHQVNLALPWFSNFRAAFTETYLNFSALTGRLGPSSILGKSRSVK